MPHDSQLKDFVLVGFWCYQLLLLAIVAVHVAVAFLAHGHHPCSASRVILCLAIVSAVVAPASAVVNLVRLHTAPPGPPSWFTWTLMAYKAAASPVIALSWLAYFVSLRRLKAAQPTDGTAAAGDSEGREE
jgi:hypothetical protein